MAGQSEKVSRRELQETIEKQQEQINRYETRLRDLVRAYKGLTKEKEALEKSLNAISAKKSEENVEKNLSPNVAGNGGDSELEDKINPNELKTLQAQVMLICCFKPSLFCQSYNFQVQTLTASLSTVSSEKSRLELHFQEYKKKSVNEKRGYLSTIETLQQELQTVKVT